jgi:hypothetical protein
VLTFDFSSGLATGETLAGPPSVSYVTVFGGDSSPGSLSNGSPSLDPTSTLVLLPVTGGIDANDYAITVTVGTTNSKKTLALAGLLPVRLYPRGGADECGC